MMLDTADLSLRLPKEGYKARLRACQQRLHTLQPQCLHAGHPVMVVFEGWEGAGQAAIIDGMQRRLETRSRHIHDIQPPRTFETHLPWLWRFWLKLPRYGEIAIFNHSWYAQILAERITQGTARSNWRRTCRDTVNFERALTYDGYIICKFFLHVSKKQQKKRFRALQEDPLRGWRIQETHWEQHRQYAQYAAAIDEMLKRTHTEWAPWVVVEAHQRRWAQIKVLDTIIQRIEAACETPNSESAC